MFCGNCGKQIQDNAAVCPYCGAPTGAAEEVHAQPQYGAQTPSYNQQNYGAQPQPYNQQYNSYGAQGYSAGYPAGEIPENGFDSVNKVIQAKLGYVDNRPVTHAYQRLGGFLAVATYRWGILALILAYDTIQILTSLSKISSFFSGLPVDAGGVSGALVVLGILIFIIMGIAVAINLLMFIFLEKKNTVFLKFYEIVAIVVTAIVALCAILILTGIGNLDMGGFSDKVMSILTGILIPMVFWTAAIYGLWILYFGKSVRVRTYFGTDEYLRRSIFCRKWKYPVPMVPDRPAM